MALLTTLLSPFNLLFLIIFTGFAIGKVRIKHISLGIAGILFVAIFVGFLMNLLIPEENAEVISNAQSTMKTFSKLGTSLFVSVIGLQTGFSIKNNSKNSMIAFAIGALMSISGVAVMLLISVLDKSITYPSLLGILCGALTSTPGLSSVCELIDIGSDEAVLGYGCSYLLGVIFVVFFAQIFSPTIAKEDTKTKVSHEIKSKMYPELMMLCATALLGNIISNIKIANLSISFSTTASTLTVGLIVGLIINKTFIPKGLSTQCLNIFRNLGLALFFTGTGFSTGVQTVTLNIKTVIYGALITLFSVFIGFLLCILWGNKFDLHKGFIIAGGMTSSPAYGVIINDTTESYINCFSFSYFGALMSLIVSMQFICI